jgi:glucose/arabinose dehydrogenase
VWRRAIAATLIAITSHAATARHADCQGLAVDLQPVVSGGLQRPLAIADPGDGTGRLFIVQLTGEILIWDGTELLPTPFLDVSSLISCCGERGLLGLAFHPDYDSNGEFFIDYTRLSDGATVVARYTVSAGDPNLADTASAMVLLTVPQPYANHNGGHLAFGPDGYLYIGLGDGGSGGDPDGNGQNPATLLGSLLRIDVDGTDPGLEYAVPLDNPFVGDPAGRDEIWAYGLRNPWRFSFDRLTGDLFIGDVGQAEVEEIDFQPVASAGGENYGWNIMEGSTCYGGGTGCNDGTLVLPILEYTHDLGRSVTGGFRYRGTDFPRLQGVYLYADYSFGTIWGTVPRCDGAWESRVLAEAPFPLSTFGEDAAGELYVAGYSFTNGSIHRVVVAAGTGGPTTGVDPSPLDLAPARVTETASAEFLVSNLNTGPEALLITGIALADTTRFAFNVDGGSAPCGSVTPCLGPGESCTLEITFSSPSPDSYATVLTLTGNSPSVAVPITATSYEPCTLQPHRTLQSGTVSDARLEQACLTVTAGPYAIVAPGDVTLLAGQRIVLRNGFSVGSGATFSGAIDPVLALP